MKDNGFSLVELSIVLVILGLLVGGVLSGQALIKAAQLRSVTKEYSDIVMGVNAFKDKYFYLPGDMPNATQFWQKQGGLGGYAGFCNSNSGAGYNPGTQLGACDGNGDGKVELCATLGTCEDAQFWQHLKMSGIFQVTVVAAQGDEGIGINFGGFNSLHNSRYPRGAWSTSYVPATSGQFTFAGTDSAGGSPAQTLGFGLPGNSTAPAELPLLTPEDAWNIDTKMDDGKAMLGKVRVTHSGVAWDGCITNTTDYPVTDTQRQCALVFDRPF